MTDTLKEALERADAAEERAVELEKKLGELEKASKTVASLPASGGPEYRAALDYLRNLSADVEEVADDGLDSRKKLSRVEALLAEIAEGVKRPKPRPSPADSMRAGVAQLVQEVYGIDTSLEGEERRKRGGR